MISDLSKFCYVKERNGRLLNGFLFLDIESSSNSHVNIKHYVVNKMSLSQIYRDIMIFVAADNNNFRKNMYHV